MRSIEAKTLKNTFLENYINICASIYKFQRCIDTCACIYKYYQHLVYVITL